MFTIRTQQQVLTWNSYVLAWTSLGPECNVYLKKKKVKSSFLILYLGEGGKANKQIKNQSKEDRRAQVDSKGEICHNYK